MPLLERISWFSCGTEKGLKFGRKQCADMRRTAIPGIVNLLPMVSKVLDINLKSAVFLQFYDLSHFSELRGLSIGSQSHDLVLISIVGKAKILGQCLIENAKRVRKVNAILYVNIDSLSYAPSIDATDASLNGETRNADEM